MLQQQQQEAQRQRWLAAGMQDGWLSSGRLMIDVNGEFYCLMIIITGLHSQ